MAILEKKTRTTIYIDEVVHKDFFRICDRENESASKKLEEFMRRYIDVHGEGNPQMRLDRYGALPTHECFFCQARVEPIFRVKYVSGLVAPTCQVCLDQNKEKGPYSTVKKVMGVID